MVDSSHASVDWPADRETTLHLGRTQLDAVFSAAAPGRIPDGRARGTALLAPGSPFNIALAWYVRRFVWQGKVFDARGGRLSNLVTPFGIEAVRARVYEGTSWFDNKPCIVLDYARTSLIAHWIRDEIREIRPGVYFGIAFWARWRLMAFRLDVRSLEHRGFP